VFVAHGVPVLLWDELPKLLERLHDVLSVIAEVQNERVLLQWMDAVQAREAVARATSISRLERLPQRRSEALE